MTFSELDQLKDWVSDCVGLPETEVIEAIEMGGGVWRLTRRDGEPVFVSRDFVPHRINLVVENGIVKEARLG